MEISGEGVYRQLKHEGGVHRVQRVPKTEKAGRIHTSTITVSVMPLPKEVGPLCCACDLKIDVWRGLSSFCAELQIFLAVFDPDSDLVIDNSGRSPDEH